MALWKARSLSPEQKEQIVEEQSDVKTHHSKDNGSLLGMTDVKMFEVSSAVVPLAVCLLS